MGLRKSKVLSAGYQDSTKYKGTGLEGKEADSFCICFCSNVRLGYDAGARGGLAILQAAVRMPSVRKEASKN